MTKKGDTEATDDTVDPDAPATPAELIEATPVAYSSPLMAKQAEELAKAYARELRDEPDGPAASLVPGDERYRGPDWAGLPNYYCPDCAYATTGGPNEVHEHRVGAHADKVAAEALAEAVEV